MDPFEALGDPHRRTILTLLGEGDRSVQELADRLPISRPAVSQHLKVLKDSGLVDEDAEGTRRIYRLNEVGMLALRDQLDTFWSRTLGNLRSAAERPEETNDPDR